MLLPIVTVPLYLKAGIVGKEHGGRNNSITSGQGRDELGHQRNKYYFSWQIWACGQVKHSNYQFLFGNTVYRLVTATKDSFRDRQHYLNMKNCITAMLENKVLPVVNENDAIAITELMFTDNDELSGMISSMMDCGSLIILTNVDGIYTGLPGSEGSELIREIGNDSIIPNIFQLQNLNSAVAGC